MMMYILNAKHEPIPCYDAVVLSNWLQEHNNGIVKKTEIGESSISTVFLGIHSQGKPILFETMVFGLLDPDNDIQERYHTWDEAIEGHDKMVERFKNANSI